MIKYYRFVIAETFDRPILKYEGGEDFAIKDFNTIEEAEEVFKESTWIEEPLMLIAIYEQ